MWWPLLSHRRSTRTSPHLSVSTFKSHVPAKLIPQTCKVLNLLLVLCPRWGSVWKELWDPLCVSVLRWPNVVDVVEWGMTWWSLEIFLPMLNNWERALFYFLFFHLSLVLIIFSINTFGSGEVSGAMEFSSISTLQASWDRSWVAGRCMALLLLRLCSIQQSKEINCRLKGYPIRLSMTGTDTSETLCQDSFPRWVHIPLTPQRSVACWDTPSPTLKLWLSLRFILFN